MTESDFDALSVSFEDAFACGMALAFHAARRPEALALASGFGDRTFAELNGRSNALVRFFAWNMPYHVEHHLHPSVPFHALPKLHERLKDQLPAPYGGCVPAYREMIATFIRQQRDPSYFVRPVLPETQATRA